MTSEPLRSSARLSRVAVAGVAVGVLLVGCGGSDSGTTKPETAASTSPTTLGNGTVPATTAGNGAMTVKQFQFMPAELSVKAATNVTWTNQDDILHTATSGRSDRSGGSIEGCG